MKFWPKREQVNEERPAINLSEAALDTLRQHGWNAEDWVAAIGEGDSTTKQYERAIRALQKYKNG